MYTPYEYTSCDLTCSRSSTSLFEKSTGQKLANFGNFGMVVLTYCMPDQVTVAWPQHKSSAIVHQQIKATEGKLLASRRCNYFSSCYLLFLTYLCQPIFNQLFSNVNYACSAHLLDCLGTCCIFLDSIFRFKKAVCAQNFFVSIAA